MMKRILAQGEKYELILPAQDCSLCKSKSFIGQASSLRVAVFSGISIVCTIVESPYMNKQTNTLANIRRYSIYNDFCSDGQ